MTPARLATERARSAVLSRYRVLKRATAPLGFYDAPKVLSVLCETDAEYNAARDCFVAAVREEEKATL